MSNTKFIIKDWAGNVCFHAKEFESFEDAWAHIYDFHNDLSEKDFEETMGEYYVEVI